MTTSDTVYLDNYVIRVQGQFVKRKVIYDCLLVFYRVSWIPDQKIKNLCPYETPSLHCCSRSVCWPTKPFMENRLHMLAPSLLSHTLRSNKGISLSVLRSGPTQAQELFTLVPCLFGTTCRCLSVQPYQLLPSRNISGHISLTWPPPIDTRTPDGLLMLWNCFIDLAVEHQFSGCTTEPRLRRGYWRYRKLIDWFEWASLTSISLCVWSLKWPRNLSFTITIMKMLVFS